jgi:intracellular multiplication protein IcmE
MGDRINNMGKMMNNPKQRNMYFMIAGVVVVTVIAGFWFATRNHANNTPEAGAQVAAVPSINVVPGASTNPDYNKKVAQNNDVQAQKALNNNNTYVPTVTNTSGMSDSSPLDQIDKEKDKHNQVKVDVPASAPVVVASAPVVTVAPPVVQAPAPVVKKAKYSQDDYILIATLANSWKTKEPSSEFDFTKNKGNGSAQEATQTASAATASSSTVASAPPLAKAGTIFNAVLETAINSDEPSPVLAKIVSGPLKGTRLIGSIQTEGEKVVVQFTTASLPNYANSVKLNAVAVDPDSTRTALASDVDHHYIEKYGLLLASSFLSGYSTAIARENTTTSVGPLGNVTVSQGELTSSQINKQALGNVGTQLANTAQQNIQNVKPTITVVGGSAVGILLMEDLKISTN